MLHCVQHCQQCSINFQTVFGVELKLPVDRGAEYTRHAIASFLLEHMFTTRNPDGK